MMLLSVAMLAWVVLQERDAARSRAETQRQIQPRSSVRAVFALLLLLAMTTVGVETSLSGWLTTYSHRAGMQSLAGAALATSIFWLGEMLSRLVFSTRLLAKVGRRQVLQWGIWGVTVAAVAVIAAPASMADPGGRRSCRACSSVRSIRFRFRTSWNFHHGVGFLQWEVWVPRCFRGSQAWFRRTSIRCVMG